MQPSRPQIFVFSYHKSGTELFNNIMAKLARRLGLRVATCVGKVWAIDSTADIVLVWHSLLGCQLSRPFRAIRVVRDPRDIWLSGYLYHRHCNEPWCTNTNFDTTPPIAFPRVPIACNHRPERWKRNYLASLGGKSYQQNLLDRDRDAGLAFELAHYAGSTMQDIRAWSLSSDNVIDVKLETIAQDFDGCMRTIFRHLGFGGSDLETAIEIAASEDIARMDDASIAANPHIHSREISKWRGVLSPEQVETFEHSYHDIVTRLGYELSV